MRGVRYIFDESKNALRLLKSRNAITFLTCLVIALFFWAFQTLSKNYETIIKIPINNNIPPSISVSPTPPQTLNVKVSGKGSDLLIHYIYRIISPININPQTHDIHKEGELIIDEEGVYSMVKNTLRDSKLNILNISPSQIAYSYAPKAKREMPIIMKGQIIPNSDILIKRVKMTPENAIAYGDKAILDSLKVVRTDTTSFTNIKGDTILRFKIVPPFNTNITPDSVDAEVLTERIIEQTFDIPIDTKITSHEYTLRTFPTVVKVSCWIPESRVRDLSSNQIHVSVEKFDPNRAIDKLRIIVDQFPDYVYRIQSDPGDVEYLLEKNH